MPIDADTARNLNYGELDLAVAREEGYDVRDWAEIASGYARIFFEDTPAAYIGTFNIALMRQLSASKLDHYTPSVDPRFAAEIIDREFIATEYDPEAKHWLAWRSNPQESAPERFHGETPRVAAMRCYVATGRRFPSRWPAS